MGEKDLHQPYYVIGYLHFLVRHPMTAAMNSLLHILHALHKNGPKFNRQNRANSFHEGAPK